MLTQTLPSEYGDWAMSLVSLQHVYTHTEQNRMSEYPSSFAELATGARLHYVDTGAVDGGSDVPVVAIHGLVGTAATQLATVMDWLRPNYRVIGPSLRGYGQSTPKPRQFPPNFYHIDADDVLALLNVLDIPKAHILGYSDGGEAALLFAGKYPERVQSVAVWGAVGYYGPAMRPVAQNTYPGDWMTEAEKALHGIDDPAHFTLEWVQAVRFIIDSGGDLSLSLIKNCTAPVLLMLGDQDTLNPADYARKIADNAPNGRVAMFGCGHAVHTESQAEFEQTVGEFLRTAES